MKARLALMAFLVVISETGCNPMTTRPGFRPFALAAVDTSNSEPSITLTAIESQINERGLPIRRSNARDGYLETRRFDLETETVDGAAIHDSQRAIVMRFWVNPVPGKRSQIISEVVYRRTADPSVSNRAAEALVPPDHPARELLAEVLAAVKADGRAE